MKEAAFKDSSKVTMVHTRSCARTKAEWTAVFLPRIRSEGAHVVIPIATKPLTPESKCIVIRSEVTELPIWSCAA
ncbi:hypothetical protein Q8A67_002470 [Cirrhinus molitorella]|uniref:Uncharacterized protein n=1 Tax=Cirrhinus molitorella TaxID=172907 RepID=A0AA88Q6G6_9TELE|nr:hypothetical protein Q8A67_002470 [Cirrhinus molitorella]